ncbi:TPA: hypothetical protein QC153_002193 [Bacillus cereus]|nr:hypothetical protein [Bacillus cereus]
MISKLTVKKEVKEVVAGSVILSVNESGKEFTYLIVEEGGNKVRIIDVERGYLYSHELDREAVVNHIENYWDEQVLEVFQKDEIHLTEAK